jgi:GT2 family glycosyltransferase
MKISFVILHYQNLEITKQCIECLRLLEKYDECGVVIVDNCSPNNSGKYLTDLYKTEANIYVICNNSNLGFANGNNIGYLFAKNRLRANLIIVMNNDVLIEQKNFIVKLKSLYYNSKIQIIAPDIINLDGFHQNPFRKHALSNKQLKKIYIYNMILKIIYIVPFINIFTAKILQYKNINKKFDCNIEKNHLYNIVPHGACVIYLDNWIHKENFAFLPDTFMYFEEDILFEYVMRKNYKIEYCPELYVKHIEDVSVNSINRTELKKRKFIADNFLKSVKILINMRKL